ncbi:alpha/beta hydrolase [Niveibacterium sp. SC-1]|uniref:alpha/beta fold hydrolase n=1 Tax=Niveibacterium sp. SC-1 TaxID=3135646 RepID=UPI00311DCF8D
MQLDRTLAVGDSEVHYTVLGEGLSILILHGWGVDHRLMSGPLEELFADGALRFRRIYLDLPGMGASRAGPSVRSSDQMLEILLRFVEAVLPGQDFLLAGESYGGYLARGLLRQVAPRVRGLMLLCPLIVPGYRQGTVPATRVLERDDALLDRLSRTQREAFTYITVRQTEPVWQDFARDILPALETRNRAFLETQLDGAFSEPIHEEPLHFDKPALILLGRQDAEVGYADQTHLCLDLPRASVAVLDQAGHNLQIEQKPLFMALVRDWLERASAG